MHGNSLNKNVLNKFQLSYDLAVNTKINDFGFYRLIFYMNILNLCQQDMVMIISGDETFN